LRILQNFANGKAIASAKNQMRRGAGTAAIRMDERSW